MNKKKKIISYFLLFILIFNIATISVLAETPITSLLYFSQNTVESGDNVTVEAIYKGSDIGKYEIYIKYDTTKLKYLDGENTGNIVFKKTLSEATSSVTVKANFKAISGGSTLISTDSSFYNFSNGEKVTASDAGAQLTISGNTKPESLETTKTTEENKNTAKPTEATTNTSVDMNKDNLVEETTQNVASNDIDEGNLKDDLEAQDKCLYESQYCDVVYSLSGVKGPKNFTLKQSHYNNKLMDTYVSADRKYSVAGIYLPESKDIIFALYDAEDKSFKPFIATTPDKSQFIIVDATTEIKNFDIVNKLINGYNYRVYTTSDMKKNSLYVVNAINESGMVEKYLFDSQTNNFIKYDENIFIANSLKAPVMEEDVDENKNDSILSNSEKATYQGIVIASCIIVFILLIVVIAISRKNKKLRDELMEPPDCDEYIYNLYKNRLAQNNDVNHSVNSQNNSTIEKIL